MVESIFKLIFVWIEIKYVFVFVSIMFGFDMIIIFMKLFGILLDNTKIIFCLV